MRIVGVIATLGSGGAERVMSLLASGWAARGDAVTLVTIDDAPPFFPLHPSVRTLRLGLARDSGNLLERASNVALRARALRRAVRELAPDVCVSFIDRMNVLAVMATRGLGVPLIVSERVHPGFVDPRGWRIVRDVAYRWADVVVAQTERTAQALRRPLGPPIVTIPNPVTDPGEVTCARSSHRIVAAGRLVRQKGFDLLLRAFASVAASREGWHVVIWGEGPERVALESLARQLGIDDRVHLPGRTPEVIRELRQADIFVLSSRFEGFPNVLCEAMSVGLPVIAFDCPSGPGEIIEHERDGLIVEPEDVGALSYALARLMDDPVERDVLGARARAVRGRLGLEPVLVAWDRAFRRAGA